MSDKPFEKGEVRLFEFKVASKTEAPVIVSSAIWELRGKEVIARGNCDVNNDIISMVVPMQTAGEFILEVTAYIPPETIIERMFIRVVE